MPRLATFASALFLAFAASCALAYAAPKARLADMHWQKHDPASEQRVDHKPWADFLSSYLVMGEDGIARLPYGGVSKENADKLATYVKGLEAVPVSTLNRDEQMAYWINFYNALTVHVVLQNYPAESILKILSGGFFRPGPWKRELVEVEGRKLSLDDMEHGILRPLWHDPRIHYAVNCASLGCPNLAASPYEAGQLQQQLDTAARAYINHPRGVTVDQRGQVIVSKIFDWYKDDFGGTDAGVLDHLRRYADDPLKQLLADQTRISDFRYDWQLNDAAVKTRTKE